MEKRLTLRQLVDLLDQAVSNHDMAQVLAISALIPKRVRELEAIATTWNRRQP